MRPLRIGFDGLTITARPSGIGSAAAEVLDRLARGPGAPEIVAVLPQGSAADPRVAGLSNVDVVRAPFPGPDTPRALVFQHRTMPSILAAKQCDALFAPSFVMPLLAAAPPAVVVFHDASWRRFPASKSALFRAYMDWAVPRSCRRAAEVLADSEFARSEALAIVPGLDAANVRVAPLGARALPAPADVPGALARLRVPEPYLLAVSNFDPRKNLDALVAAWREARARGDLHGGGSSNGVAPALVLVGDPARAAALRERVGARPDEALVTPGYVSAEDLAALYARAAAVVVPSLYEGFGLPVLEAFLAGTPVACSNRASLPEVAGDAALLFDPEDPAAMAAALREAARPGPERDARVARGRARAADFTWERTAAAVLASLERAASRR